LITSESTPDSRALVVARSGWWLAAILALAVAFRWLGPFLQHSTGDSPHYVALAMKLRTSGLSGYNLRGVDLCTRSLDASLVQHLMQLKPSSPSDLEGDLIRDLRREGLGYYDEPLHHIAYGYPVLLACVHVLSGNAPQTGWELVNTSLEPWDLIRFQPLILAVVQWHWLAPSFLCSLGAVLLTYILGAEWFGKAAGLWGAFLMATFPVDILTAQRIWADDALVFLCLAALLCGWLALERRSMIAALCGGILLGIAFLMKQSALFFAASVGMVELMRWRKQSQTPPANSSPCLSGRLIAVCVAGLFLAVGHWLFIEWKAWGTLFPVPKGLAAIATNPWHQVLMDRPSPIILYTVGLAVLSPGIFLAGMRFREPRIRWILLTAVCYAAFIVAVDGREYRYVLPVIPLLAMAAGHFLAQIGGRWKAVLVLLVIGQIAWSFFLTDRYAWRNSGEIMIPF